MLTVWVMTIVLTLSGEPTKFFMIDGRAYASQGLCQMSGIRKAGNAISNCEEISVKQTK